MSSNVVHNAMNLPEDVRARLRALSEQSRRFAHREWRQYYSMILKSLAEKEPESPLTMVYVSEPLNAKHNPALLAAYRKVDRNDLPVNGSDIISGRQQFVRLTESPDYPIRSGDLENARKKIEEIRDDCQGANVVELCAGDLKLLGETIDLIREGASASDPHKFDPKTVVSGDFIPLREQWDYVRAELESRGFSRDRTPLLRGDINEEVWRTKKNQRLLQKLRRDKARTVVFLRGATWNDFSSEERVALLKSFKQEFKAGTIIYITCDNTLEIGTLLKMYGERFKQLILTGEYTKMRILSNNGADYVPPERSPDTGMKSLFQGVRCQVQCKESATGIDVVSSIFYPHDVVIRVGTDLINFGGKQNTLPYERISKVAPHVGYDEMQAAGVDFKNVIHYSGPQRLMLLALWKLQTPVAAPS